MTPNWRDPQNFVHVITTLPKGSLPDDEPARDERLNRIRQRIGAERVRAAFGHPDYGPDVWAVECLLGRLGGLSDDEIAQKGLLLDEIAGEMSCR